jgi:hypothetical protein
MFKLTTGIVGPLALISIGLTSAALGQGTKSAQERSVVKGISIHHCSCVVGCPCMFGPQLSDCRMVMVHHVERGTLNGIRLDGATVVTVLPSFQDLAAKPPPRFRGAIYVPKDRPRAAQDLLVRMFTPKSLRSGKQLLATPATVRFERTSNGFRTEVPGYVRAQTKARLGRDGKQLIVKNVNFAEGSTWRVGESTTLTLNEPMAGWKWNLTGRNGTWSEWTWDAKKGHQSIEPGVSTGNASPAPAAAGCACCL